MIIFYFFRIFLEICLSLYGYFKHNDFDSLENQNKLTKCLDKIEQYHFMRYIFNYKEHFNETTKSTEMKSFDSPSISPISQETFQSPLKNLANKKTNENPIKIIIDKYLSLKFNKDSPSSSSITRSQQTANVYFCIRTHLSQNEYVTEKTYTEFYKFFVFLKNSKSAENNEIQNLIETSTFIDEDPSNSEKMLLLITQLEEFLQKIINDPGCFCRYEVLKFFNIIHKRKKPLDLFQNLPRRFSQALDLSPLMNLKKIEITSRRKTREFFTLKLENIEMEYSDLSSSLIKQFFFNISAIEYKLNTTTNNTEYCFLITNLSKTPIPKSWKIWKTYSCFKKLNNDLEIETCSKIPNFDAIVPKLSNYHFSNNPQFINKRKDALLQYLQEIVRNFLYHGETLYNFLNFDAEKGNSNNFNMKSSINISALLQNTSARLVNKSIEEIQFFTKFEDEIKEKTSNLSNSSKCIKRYHSLMNLSNIFYIKLNFNFEGA